MRELTANAGVATELWTEHVFELEFVLGGEVEEPAGNGQEFVYQLLVDTMADKIKETHVVRHPQKIGSKPCRFVSTGIQARKIKNRQIQTHWVVLSYRLRADSS